jgi:hypothetical protein
MPSLVHIGVSVLGISANVHTISVSVSLHFNIIVQGHGHCRFSIGSAKKSLNIDILTGFEVAVMASRWW